MRTLDQLLRGVADPTQPLITYYDMSTGERVELSTVTTANWVAKTSNFLVDELDAEPGTRIRIGLPSHWLTMVWILSAWNVAAAVVDHDAQIGVSGPELQADEPHRVAASLRPLGGRFASPPPGFLDLGAEVPGHGDHFVALDPPEASSLALDLEGERLSHADVLTAARPSDVRRVVAPGTLPRDAQLLVDACLGGGSLVLVASATSEQISRVAAQEGGLLS
ncbi:TIGR03089 family protein [Aeromicrobium wangtongii]|uniref:TIGR03089 family protein n=1 Tax=Aeromicrobium wangtongii TaxID=2969247 RepID=A0ABY5M8U6_9ACTN|nr:TIGR03089 family protein [Aeromicrobium wangtongii]MCD9197057.1 TIGR03089 family protein [Aeromicrobium wangtongii]UUP14558.1 TIGR03089 family protein [Aeromicrobium wangtongii]